MDTVDGYNHIGSWLPPLLDKAHLSPEELANQVGVSRTAIYFYMADYTRPASQVMVRICRVLGVPFEEGLAQYTPRRVGRPPGIRDSYKRAMRPR